MIATHSEISAKKTTDLLITSNELLMTAIKFFIFLPCRLPQKWEQGAFWKAPIYPSFSLTSFEHIWWQLSDMDFFRLGDTAQRWSADQRWGWGGARQQDKRKHSAKLRVAASATHHIIQLHNPWLQHFISPVILQWLLCFGSDCVALACPQD